MLLPASVVCAQYVTTIIDISPKVQIENLVPFALEQHPDFDSGTLVLKGTMAMQISAHENLAILASVTHNGKLTNENGHELPLSAFLAYRNDGGNPQDLPQNNTCNAAEFMMSNSGLLINSMKPNPNVINAYLYLETITGMPQYANTTYVGSIYLNIEFN